MFCLLQITKEKRELRGRRSSSLRRPKMEIFSVRRFFFSQRSRAIGPLDFDGARRENVLRKAGYAWTPDLWSFLKLQEVGVSPYSSFTLILSVFRCFGLFEAVRGRLIGPKTWDRIVGIFLRFSLVVVTVQKLRGLFGCFNYTNL